MQTRNHKKLHTSIHACVPTNIPKHIHAYNTYRPYTYIYMYIHAHMHASKLHTHKSSFMHKNYVHSYIFSVGKQWVSKEIQPVERMHNELRVLVTFTGKRDTFLHWCRPSSWNVLSLSLGKEPKVFPLFDSNLKSHSFCTCRPTNRSPACFTRTISWCQFCYETKFYRCTFFVMGC